MVINFSIINLEVIDINTCAALDAFIDQNGITLSKRVIEDLNYPKNVQFCVDGAHKIWLSASARTMRPSLPYFQAEDGADQHAQLWQQESAYVIAAMIPGFDNKKRYKATGEYNAENRVMYFDMTTAEECNFCYNVAKAELSGNRFYGKTVI